MSVFSLFSVIMAENSMSEIAIGEVFGPVILRPSHENLTYVTISWRSSTLGHTTNMEELSGAFQNYHTYKLKTVIIIAGLVIKLYHFL